MKDGRDSEKQEEDDNLDYMTACPFLLGHVLAGLPPGHTSDRARMSQVDKGEVNRRRLFIRGVLNHHCRAPAGGGIPHFE